MPSPALYALAVVGTVAAGLAFKEFVYDPHIHPHVRQFAEELRERRRQRLLRRSRSSLLQPEGFTYSVGSDGSPEYFTELRSGYQPAYVNGGIVKADGTVEEVGTEMLERNNVSGLRHRMPVSHDSEDDALISLSPTMPSQSLPRDVRKDEPEVDEQQHILFDHVSPSPSPPPRELRERPSSATLRSPQPTHGSPVNSPPSLSLSHPLAYGDVDAEADVELLSRPSSANTLFSDFPVSPQARSPLDAPPSSLGRSEDDDGESTSPFVMPSSLAGSTTSHTGDSMYHSFTSPFDDPFSSSQQFIEPFPELSASSSEAGEEPESDVDFLSDLDMRSVSGLGDAEGEGESEMSWEDAEERSEFGESDASRRG